MTESDWQKEATRYRRTIEHANNEFRDFSKEIGAFVQLRFPQGRHPSEKGRIYSSDAFDSVIAAVKRLFDERQSLAQEKKDLEQKLETMFLEQVDIGEFPQKAIHLIPDFFDSFQSIPEEVNSSDITKDISY